MEFTEYKDEETFKNTKERMNKFFIDLKEMVKDIG